MVRRNKEYVRYRYGICLNETCSKANSKEVQQIAARKEFVCEECGKPVKKIVINVQEPLYKSERLCYNKDKHRKE